MPGVDGAVKSLVLCHCVRLKLGSRWCNTPRPVLRGAGNQSPCGSDSVTLPVNRGVVANTNICLSDDKNPAYAPAQFC